MENWIYLVDPIESATQNNFKKALRVSIYHDGALLAKITPPLVNPFIQGLYDLYHPLHLAYVDAYEIWHSEIGAQQGETLSLNQLLRLLRGPKIKNWDIGIQSHYDNTTPKYKSLLPNHRTPFQIGTQSDRISAVHGLSVAIGTDAALASVKADVDLTYSQLMAANTTQKGSKSTTIDNSKAVEQARVAMCQQQYYNLGAFIQHYVATPLTIAQYYDLEAIRSAHQVLFTGHVNPQNAHFVVKHTFGLLDMLRIYNKGVTVLEFYLAPLKGNMPATHFLSLQPGTEHSGLASTVGDLADKYIMVYNPNAVDKGEYEIEFL
ncbi:MAG: hypothetical protein WCH34_16780 [Bacteroidota bacterium]